MLHELPLTTQADPKDGDTGGDNKTGTKNPASLGKDKGKGTPKKP